MAKPLPMHLRLYREPHLIALVRLIGYGGLPVPEARERMKPLIAEYGAERMKAAAREVIRVDLAQEPPVARLTEPVRRLAWQLLGPPAEAAAAFHQPAGWPSLPALAAESASDDQARRRPEAVRRQPR